jgi:hypothetical protein
MMKYNDIQANGKKRGHTEERLGSAVGSEEDRSGAEVRVNPGPSGQALEKARAGTQFRRAKDSRQYCREVQRIPESIRQRRDVLDAKVTPVLRAEIQGLEQPPRRR